ncbi:hypothetical protein ACW5WK_01580 [Aeromonas enteropelogenes]|uniref:hypothetical protein n=2 Tax=Aeromonadaceae TaxID=84642 RepID=UPI0012E0481A|nr:hypothetical protein [Aeromonas enteropelogenes]UBH56074.1 hypothetical protein LA341_19710 [Aeromonas enteropelogenes]
MFVGTESIYNETMQSLTRIQNFDPNSLARESELGQKLNFSEAISYAKLLIDLYNRLSTTALQDFPDDGLTKIRDNSNSHFKIFSQILDFDLE